MLSITTIFLADSSTTHHDQKDVLTVIIKTIPSVTVFCDSHLGITCTVLLTELLLCLEIQTVNSDTDSQVQPPAHTQRSNVAIIKAMLFNQPTNQVLLTSCEACFILSTIPSWPKYCKESHRGRARSFSTG